ncbi:alpha/beta hydrolase-fold protein [Nocardioides cavernaquae]|uniref:Acyl-CoA:diacylglycerol acyltransferase n=1 Tax=Nocardioides cavernaquae TaxID=2321396 RepID=A0A3A5HG53_9ACTN|nr:alpha/beta hydrolase-fold protein [Nocardioides cavernaquae]RJS47044.1 esterase [Nocardioides cavernaquae]
MGITRRGLLTGALGGAATLAGAGALVDVDVLPGRVAFRRELGLNGDAGLIPDIEPGEVEHGTLAGADWWIARPPGATGTLPVVVALHGAHSSAEDWLRTMGLDRFLAASGASFALAGIDGGTKGYWHPRDDGHDPRALVLDHFLPLLASHGLEAESPGLLGWSMGGYGALLFASELDRKVPVVATSPALWNSYDATVAGAYDSRADFERWRILGDGTRLDALRKLEIRVDCGRGDPFLGGVKDLRDELPDAEVHLAAGAHDAAYWTRVLPAQLAWLGSRMD